MNTPRQAARQRRQRRRLIFGAATAVICAAVAAVLVMVLLPGGDSDAQSVATATDATTDRPSPSTATATTKPSPSKSPSPSASKSSASAKPKPAATPRPSRKPAAAPQAGRIRPGATYQGVATHYEAGDGNGACLFGPSPDLMIAAMNTTDYETSRACGAHVLVRAANGKTVTVRITNECPSPCAPGQIDLSKQAFAKLAALNAGRIPITWSLVSPSTSEKISVRYKTGSSRHWCAVQAIGHRNPVARLEVRTSAGWRQLPRTMYNYFLAENGNGCGGAIRLTDIYGEQLTVPALAVRPDVAQPTGLQFARR